MESEITERLALHGRFKGASWYPFVQNIVVGGVGGIGSWLTVLLARQGHKIRVYDHDSVSKINLGGQFYTQNDIGSRKVDAIGNHCWSHAEHRISVVGEKFTINSSVAPVTFACFDNMTARKMMFEKWAECYTNDDKSSELHPKVLFVDGRLNAETAEFFCVYDRKTADAWLESWFPDEKVADAPCTFKATSHCAAILAGMMVGALNNFVANNYAGEERSVPFKTSIWLPTMTVLIEDVPVHLQQTLTEDESLNKATT